jgi:hypothetical protein
MNPTRWSIVTAIIVFAVAYLIFGPVHLIPENQCTRQADGSELCTLMALPPTVPASLFGFTGTWWMPLVIASIAGLLAWGVSRYRAPRRTADRGIHVHP